MVEFLVIKVDWSKSNRANIKKKYIYYFSKKN
jgi:hypothetical protein